MVLRFVKEYKQERPDWCPKSDCLFKRRAGENLCGGCLPQPVKHLHSYNTFRICLKFSEDPPLEFPCCPVLPLMVNKGDLDCLRWIFDALDVG